MIPKQIPGVRAVHAVDAAGVHPLLLAIGSERYVPYDPDRRPRELLTLANAILGHGQLSLAKYLWIVAGEDDPQLDLRDVAAFLRHVLLRVDWRRDLHFQTCTTIDTLDYTGGRLNEGSKLVIAAAGPPRRVLPGELDGRFTLPDGLRRPRIVLPGILAVECAAGTAATLTIVVILSAAKNLMPTLLVILSAAKNLARPLVVILSAVKNLLPPLVVILSAAKNLARPLVVILSAAKNLARVPI